MTEMLTAWFVDVMKVVNVLEVLTVLKVVGPDLLDEVQDVVDEGIIFR
jgi:hypothetical protein